jgi:hypothetical protein
MTLPQWQHNAKKIANWSLAEQEIMKARFIFFNISTVHSHSKFCFSISYYYST